MYKLISLYFSLTSSFLLIAFPLPVLPDSLNEILRLTYTSNRQLVLTRAHLAAQRDAIKIASSESGVMVSTAFTGSRDWNLNAGSINDGFSGSLVGSYTLSDGMRSENKIRLQKHILSKANHQLNDLEQGVLLATINSYLNVLRDQKFVALSDGNVAVLSRQFEEVRDRFSLGEVTRTDVAQAEAALASAKANLTAKEGALATTTELFLTQVGIVPRNLEPVITSFQLPKSIKKAKQRALKKHPRILSAKEQEKIADVAIDIAAGEKKPLINLKSSLTNGYTQSTGNYNSASIKIEGSFPIFNSGRIDHKISQAESNLKAEQTNTNLVRRSVAEEISIAWSNLRVAEATIEARKRQVESSEIAYEGVVVEEKLGTRTTLNVINSEQALLNARTQLASAEKDHLFAKFSVLAASGDLNVNYLGVKVAKATSEGPQKEKRQLGPFESILKQIGLPIIE